MGTMLKKTFTAAVAAATLAGGFAVATDASAQHRGCGQGAYRGGGGHYSGGGNRGYYNGGGYRGGGYYGGRGWGAGSILAGAAIGAAIAGAPYYGGYYGGYYGPSYYGYYGAPCVRNVWRWDPYYGRRVLVRAYC